VSRVERRKGKNAGEACGGRGGPAHAIRPFTPLPTHPYSPSRPPHRGAARAHPLLSHTLTSPNGTATACSTASLTPSARPPTYRVVLLRAPGAVAVTRVVCMGGVCVCVGVAFVWGTAPPNGRVKRECGPATSAFGGGGLPSKRARPGPLHPSLYACFHAPGLAGATGSTAEVRSIYIERERWHGGRGER